MADLSSIKSGDRTIDIFHPGTKQFIGVKVSLVSLDDDRLTSVKRKITDRRLYLEARGKPFKAEEIDENMNNLIFTAMTGWVWGKDANGDPALWEGKVPDFDRRTVYDVFTKASWFRKQINEEIGETESFFDNSKTS